MVTDAAAGGTDIGPAGHLADRSQAAMSALGQKQTRAVQKVMSALPPKADILRSSRHVRFVPIADICVHGSNF
jgi:hypothetical protein